MLLYGILVPGYEKLTLSVETCPEYRVPSIEEMERRNFNTIYFCNVYNTIGTLHGRSWYNDLTPSIHLSITSSFVKWYKGIPWKKDYIKSEKDKELLKEFLKRGLIVVPRYKNDLITVWIKRTITYSKYTRRHTNTYYPFLYDVPYWVALDIIIREKMWGRDPHKTISIIFDHTIALNTIMINNDETDTFFNTNTHSYKWDENIKNYRKSG